MKNKILSVSGFCIAMLFSLSSFAQLSGNYTINSTQSASSTNYQNWASAIGDLISGSRTDGGTAQGAGVSGAVVFTVKDTVYNNISIDFTAISGASGSNTITFRSAGGDSSKCILNNPASSSSTNDFVLHLNGADYIRFIGIGFRRSGSGTYSTVIQISNDADNNLFRRCWFHGLKTPSNSSLGFNYGIGSCIYILGNADFLELDQNRFLYGYNGIYGATTCTNNYIHRNTYDTSGSSGIYMTAQTNLRIQNNEFRMGDFGPNQGHYTSYGMRIESSPSMLITGNKIQMLAVNGQVVRAIILANTTSTAALPTLVYNNWVYNTGGSGDCTGLAVYACNYLNFYYNNVLINSSIATSAAYYHYPQYTNSYIRLNNNNLVNKGSGLAVNVPGTNTGDIDSMDYNNLYSNGTNLGNWNATNYSTLSGWKSGTGRDANSLNLDPGYLSSTDLHVSNIGLNGKALLSAWVTTDIDGEARDNSTPDIGADEFFPVSLDAGINTLDSPANFCAGSRVVKVKFQNYGFDTIKSIQIHWSVNAVTQSTVNWTGNVGPGASSASISLGNYSFANNTPYAFRIWTKSPNNSSDGKPANDTLKIIKQTGLTGTYTIGDTSSSDFKSFNDAIAALSSRGICGSVVFNVKPGTYNEQLTLLQLPGMGSSNPITFQNTSNDSSKVVITLPSTTATGNNNAVLQLRGADEVHFKGITFMRTGVNPYAHVIHILNGSNNNSFSHCQMIGIRGTSANINAMNIWSDQGQDNGNVFRNNYVKFGNLNMLYTGTALARESGCIIEGNVFDSGYNQLVQISFNDGIQVRNNTFLNIIAPLAGNYDLLLNDCGQNIVLRNNVFKGVNGDVAMSLFKCVASNTSPGMIYNNIFTKGVGKGILLDSCHFQQVVYNSMYFSSNSASNAGIQTGGNTSGDLEFYNNNIYMRGGDVFYISSNAHVSGSNHNNLYARGSTFAYWGGTCNDLNGLKSLSGREGNSFSVDPFYTSTTDLHMRNPLLKGAGIPISGVSTDMDGELRHATTPDIGADEFKLSPNDAGVFELYKPLVASCADVLDIEIIIKNFGNDTLKSASIHWTANGVAQTPFQWTGKLPSKGTDTLVIGSFNFLKSLNPKFVIWTTAPNGQADGIEFNDTFTGNRSMRNPPTANAGPDKTSCAGSFVSIGSAAIPGNTYTWNDLTFQQSAGSGAIISVSPPTKTEYELIVTNATFGCSRRDTVVVSVNAKPKANAGADKSICFGQTAQIGLATQAGFTYSWTSVPAGFTSSVANPSVSPNQSTLYILEKIISATGCNDLDSVWVYVSLKPTPNIQGVSSVCEKKTAVYSTASNAGNSYVWLINGGSIQTGQNTSSINVLWTTPGTQQVQVIETNPTACVDTSTFNIVVHAKPKARFEVTEVCFGTATEFSDSSTGAVSYRWNFGDGGSSVQQHPKHTYALAGSYNIQLAIESNAGCTDTATGIAFINAIPQAGFKYVKDQGLGFTFTDTSKGSNIVEWEWDFGDGNLSTQQNPTHQYNSESSYTVGLCVTSNRGCRHCTSHIIAAVGLEELQKMLGLSCYPNPGSGLYTLKAIRAISQYEVRDLNGRILVQAQPETEEVLVDLQDVADGIYLLRVEIDGQLFTFKVVKQS